MHCNKSLHIPSAKVPHPKSHGFCLISLLFHLQWHQNTICTNLASRQAPSDSHPRTPALAGASAAAHALGRILPVVLKSEQLQPVQYTTQYYHTGVIDMPIIIFSIPCVVFGGKFTVTLLV